MNIPAKDSNVSTWLDWIESIHPKDIDLGLARMQRAFNRLNLTLSGKIITAAGTNGKGTTLFALEQILLSRGKRVARFSSPHLLSFNERICLQGLLVSDAQLTQAFHEVAQSLTEPLTFFEFTTLAALFIFSRQKLDYILLEVGLGGRLDAVNILDPVLAIMTSIDYDHQEYLGDTLEQIASEKAGIMRPNQPILLGEGVEQQSIYSHAKFLHATPYTLNKFSNLSFCELLEHRLPLNSVKLAFAAYTLIEHESPLESDHLIWQQRLGCMQLPGRMQKRNLQGIRFVLDVAHNAAAVHKLVTNLQPIKGRRIACWASPQDKSLLEQVKLLQNQIDDWIVLNVDNARISSKQCVETLAQIDVCAQVYEAADAIAWLLKHAQPHDEVIVFGSFFTVAAALRAIDNLGSPLWKRKESAFLA
jgi:dihydrofolate synthase/folylpolyglutamate synthase